LNGRNGGKWDKERELWVAVIILVQHTSFYQLLFTF
jgi:hypothetical protein